MTMELNQQNNRLVVNGFLKDKNLKHIQLRTGSDAIVGSVDVAFKDGEKHNVQRLNVFAAKETKSGNENPSYKSIAKVESDYNAGKDDPDRVHVTGQIGYDVFVNKQGQVIKTMRKNASFFSRIGKDDKKYKNEARANVVLTATDYESEITKGEPTGNTLVHNLNIGYGGRVNRIPNLKFNMKSLGDDIDQIKDVFPKGSTMSTQIVFHDYAVVQKASKVAHGFGHHEDMGVATRFVHENLIDFIKGEPVTGKQAMSSDQIQHAKNLLDQDVEQAKDANDNSKASHAKNPFSNSENPRPNIPKKPISDDDVPF